VTRGKWEGYMGYLPGNGGNKLPKCSNERTHRGEIGNEWRFMQRVGA
jgi:hypothetical protein